MPVFKKLIFAIPFLLLFYLFNFTFKNFLASGYSFLFSLDFHLLFDLLIFAVYLTLSIACFVIFATLAQDFKLVLPIAAVASLAPVIFLKPPFSFIGAGALFLSFGAVFYFLDKNLKSYLTFQPTHLLIPSIRNLVFLTMIIYSVAFYSAVKLNIQEKGFQIPDSLLDTALKFASPPTSDTNVKGVSIAQIPGITPDQLNYLKQNPDLLKKYGVDPSALDSIGSSPTTPTDASTTPSSFTPNAAVKDLIKSQFENFIKPYTNFIAPLLGLIFFVTLQTLVSIVSIFLSLFIMATFWILEKTNIIHFEKEMREVRKLVV